MKELIEIGLVFRGFVIVSYEFQQDPSKTNESSNGVKNLRGAFVSAINSFVETAFNDTSLEYCPETGGNNPYIQKAPCRNPWPKLEKEPPLKMWPCSPFINTWDKLGVNPAITAKNENEAHCSVLQPRPEYSAQFWMSNVFNGAPRDNIYDNSLFRLSIGIPSFPTGRSNSG